MFTNLHSRAKNRVSQYMLFASEYIRVPHGGKWLGNMVKWGDSDGK